MDFLDKETFTKIETLFNAFKKNTVEPGDVIVRVYAGAVFGNMEIDTVESVLNDGITTSLEYKEGHPDFVSIRSHDQTILWTDFINAEPFNRQGEFYVGYAFSSMVQTKATKLYREFKVLDPSSCNKCFSFTAPRYSDFHKTAQFGICVKKEDKQTFMHDILDLLGK